MSILKLADIVSAVSASISRGTKYDSDIPIYVRRAIATLEREYTFGYMRRVGSVTVVADTDPPVFDFPDTPMKKIRYIRYLDGTDYVYLVKVQPEDVDNTEPPIGAYFMNSLTEGQLDGIPDEDIELEIGTYVFTSQALNVVTPSTTEHDLFDYAEDVVANLTLMKMAHLDDASELMAAAKANFDLEVKSLVNYMIEEEESDQDVRSDYSRVRDERFTED